MGWNTEKIQRWLEPEPEMEALARRWRDRGFTRLLDRGCGPGRHAMYFARQGFAVTGMDRSEEALSYLRKWAAGENLPVTTVAGNFRETPFADGCFDCVIDYHASFHTDTAGYFQAVRELWRLLRPGGEAYLTLKSQNDARFHSAGPEAHTDRFTLIHPDGVPHFYAAREDLESLFRGFSLAEPVREVSAPGKESSAESVHFHLLLRKEAAL